MNVRALDSMLDRFESLADVPSHRQLRNNPLIDLLRKAVPFNHVVVGGLDLDGYTFGHGRSVDTDMPPAFIETYFAEGLGQVDPVVVVGKTSTQAFDEQQANDTLRPPARLEELKRFFGIANRLFIPVAREGAVYGGVCFTSSRPLTTGERELLVMVADPIHRTITKPLMDRFAEEQLRLTQGEVICLQLASGGLTSEEIASASQYQPETVNTYLKSATKKLGAANRVEAVATAIRRGIIK